MRRTDSAAKLFGDSRPGHALRAYAKAHVEDVHWIETCLKFGQAVAEEFERLLCAGAAVMDLPEVDDGELDPVEQGSAAA